MEVADYIKLAKHYSTIIDTCEQELQRNNMIMGVAVKNLDSDFTANNMVEMLKSFVNWFQYCLDTYTRILTMLKSADANLDVALSKIEELTKYQTS